MPGWKGGGRLIQGGDNREGIGMNGANMSMQEKKAFEPPVKRIAVQGKNGWATMPMGRCLQWFPQPGTKERENQAGSTGVIRDHRPPRAQSGRRRAL